MNLPFMSLLTRMISTNKNIPCEENRFDCQLHDPHPMVREHVIKIELLLRIEQAIEYMMIIRVEAKRYEWCEGLMLLHSTQA